MHDVPEALIGRLIEAGTVIVPELTNVLGLAREISWWPLVPDKVKPNLPQFDQPAAGEEPAATPAQTTAAAQ